MEEERLEVRLEDISYRGHSKEFGLDMFVQKETGSVVAREWCD